jgi:epoxyqueuosine reductase
MIESVSSIERTRWVCERARAVGFDLCGVAQADAVAESSELRESLAEWLARGYAGEMNYLRDPRRADPRLVLKQARSLIVVALNYNSAEPHSTERASIEGDESPRGWISRYAWGDDYHDVIGEKLETLLAAMRAEFEEPFEARAYVDTGPIVERVAAKYAGLGWLAKNTCLINEELGSWLFLGVILTTLELAPTPVAGESPPADLCGNCTLCLDACPTDAFASPYILDARRCISYLTIELRSAIPQELRGGMGRAVFGCDICQDVCPWNRKAPVTMANGFRPRELWKSRNAQLEVRSSRPLAWNQNGEDPAGREAVAEPATPNSELRFSMFAPALESLANLSQPDFSEAFRRSAVKRAKWRGLVRNACVALGNARLSRYAAARPRVIALLTHLAGSDDASIAEHAKWALERLRRAD